MHAHGDGQPHEHHGGARGGLVFDLLDSIMLAAFVVACGLLAEIAWKAWRERRAGVRYDLTPQGRAATDPEPHPHSGVRVDTSVLGQEG